MLLSNQRRNISKAKITGFRELRQNHQHSEKWQSDNLHFTFKHKWIKAHKEDDFTSRNATNTTASEDTQNLTAQGTREAHHTSQMALLSPVTWWKVSPCPTEDNICSPSWFFLYIKKRGCPGKTAGRHFKHTAMKKLCYKKLHVTSHAKVLQLNFWRFSEDAGQEEQCIWLLLHNKIFQTILGLAK